MHGTWIYVTLPKTNIFAPENGCKRETILSFWGLGLFSGALAVSFREGISPILLDKSLGSKDFNLCLLESPRFMRLTKTKTINVEYEGERKHCNAVFDLAEKLSEFLRCKHV